MSDVLNPFQLTRLELDVQEAPSPTKIGNFEFIERHPLRIVDDPNAGRSVGDFMFLPVSKKGGDGAS